MKKSGDKDNPKKQKEPKVTVKNKVKKISQHSKNKYRAIFENTGSATIIIEEDGIISQQKTSNQSDACKPERYY